jgi:hypothetical protein
VTLRTSHHPLQLRLGTKAPSLHILSRQGRGKVVAKPQRTDPLRCTFTALHGKPVIGMAPTGRQIKASFWDMHRFNDERLIVETWNVMYSLALTIWCVKYGLQNFLLVEFISVKIINILDGGTMAIPVNLKLVLRVSAYLMIAACSQSVLETYGCACASRSYTKEEIAGYRSAAAKNDLKALAEMEEYYMWRGGELPDNSTQKKKEQKLERSYRLRRLDLNDPVALEDELDHLISGGTYWAETNTKDRERALLKAKDYATRLSNDTWTHDIWDPKRPQIKSLKYIERELSYVRKFGDFYHQNRSMHEKEAEDIQMRLEN